MKARVRHVFLHPRAAGQGDYCHLRAAAMLEAALAEQPRDYFFIIIIIITSQGRLIKTT